MPNHSCVTDYRSQGHPISRVIVMGKSSRREIIRPPRGPGRDVFQKDASKVRADAAGTSLVPLYGANEQLDYFFPVTQRREVVAHFRCSR